MRAFITHHRVASYFLMAIAISWSGILLVAQPHTLPAPPDEAQRLFAGVYLAMLLGPSAAGLVVTAVQGHDALRDYRSRLTRWRVPMRWYAVAVCTAPLLVLLTTALVSMTSTPMMPAVLQGGADPAGPVQANGLPAFVLIGLAVGLGAGIFEELGWTGLAVPTLLERYGLATTGVAVGMVWGAWHYLAIHWGIGSALGDVPLLTYLVVALFAFLPPYRMLMVWVYQHTQSTLVAIIMHMALTSSMLLLGPAVSGRELVKFDLAFGGVLWAVVLVVLVVLAAERRPIIPRGTRSAKEYFHRGP
jgi:membrane protease YdiL (CAAX protease family)